MFPEQEQHVVHQVSLSLLFSLFIVMSVLKISVICSIFNWKKFILSEKVLCLSTGRCYIMKCIVQFLIHSLWINDVTLNFTFTTCQTWDLTIWNALQPLVSQLWMLWGEHLDKRQITPSQCSTVQSTSVSRLVPRIKWLNPPDGCVTQTLQASRKFSDVFMACWIIGLCLWRRTVQ